YVSELLGKGTIDKKSSGETKGRQGSSSRNYDVLGRELFTPDEVRKLDNRKCLIFIRGFDPIMDNKYIPFGHPAFDLTADGKGTPYMHVIEAESTVIGATFEILTKRSVEYYEALKKKGENIYIDELTYDEFMLLGDTELGKRFISMDEKAQKEKLQSSQNNELEYYEESVTRKVRSETKAAQQHQERKILEWEDTITNRMLHWKYSKEQIAELKRAVAVKMPMENVLEFFYPETSPQQMAEIVETFQALKQVCNNS
ncbi:MAG: type IV secretory system conjugative DNA transfer family protein, partial [Lachnospiraceae bacterium]